MGICTIPIANKPQQGTISNQHS